MNVTPAMILTLARAIEYIYDRTDLEKWGTPCEDVRKLIEELTPEPEIDAVDVARLFREQRVKPTRYMEVWREGFHAQGNMPETAKRLIAGEFDLFGDAVEAWRLSNPTDRLTKHADGHYTYWGCRLFDNEAAARKAFG